MCEGMSELIPVKDSPHRFKPRRSQPPKVSESRSPQPAGTLVPVPGIEPGPRGPLSDPPLHFAPENGGWPSPISFRALHNADYDVNFSSDGCGYKTALLPSVDGNRSA